MSLTLHQTSMFLVSHPPQRFRTFFLDHCPGAGRTRFPGRNQPRSPLCQPNKPEPRTAQLCKQYLRSKYMDKLPEVEAFIAGIEGDARDRDLSNWELFIDLEDIRDAVLGRLDLKFEQSLEP